MPFHQYFAFMICSFLLAGLSRKELWTHNAAPIPPVMKKSPLSYKIVFMTNKHLFTY